MSIDGFSGTTLGAVFPDMEIYFSSWAGTTGTFAIDSDITSQNIAQYILNDSTAKESSTGTVTITSVSSTAIAGTFSFTCSDGTVVSSGSFNAKVQP